MIDELEQVYQRMAAKAWEKRGGPKVKLPPQAKPHLTFADVADIRARRRKGETLPMIGKRYRRCGATISRICRNLSYRVIG